MLSDRLNFWTQETSMRRSSVLLLAGWLAITPLIIGCTSSLPLELPPTPSQATAKAVGNDYIIGPGDVLEVFVWRNPELSVTVPVRPKTELTAPPPSPPLGGSRLTRTPPVSIRPITCTPVGRVADPVS